MLLDNERFEDRRVARVEIMRGFGWIVTELLFLLGLVESRMA